MVSRHHGREKALHHGLGHQAYDVGTQVRPSLPGCLAPRLGVQSSELQSRVGEARGHPLGSKEVHPGAAHDAPSKLGERAQSAPDGDAARAQHTDHESRWGRRRCGPASALRHLDPARPRLHHPPDGARLVAGAETDADESAVVLGCDGETPQLFRRVRDGLLEHQRLEAVRWALVRVEVLRLRDDDPHANCAVFVAEQARLVCHREDAFQVSLVHERRRVRGRLPGVTEELGELWRVCVVDGHVYRTVAQLVLRCRRKWGGGGAFVADDALTLQIATCKRLGMPPARSEPESPEATSRRPLVVRLVRALALVCVTLALLYAVGINVFLATPLFGRVVNAQPDIIDVHYERAWSLIPGRVHARKISVRGRDGDVEWILRLDRVEFGVSFVALARMRFEATHVRGEGVSFRLRKRLERPPASQDEVADLPPIEGLPPYSVRPPERPSPAKWSDAEYDLWSAHLEDVVAAGTREVWIDHARFEGDARIEGRFFLKPMRAVEVGPVRLAVTKGSVHTGEGSIADALDGSAVDVTVARFDPRTARGDDLLRRVSLDSDAHAVVPDLGFLHVLPERAPVHGTLNVERAVLHVRSGTLERESKVKATVAPLAVDWGGYRATGSLALTADVAREAGDKRDRLTFRALWTDLLGFQRGRAARPSSAFVRAKQVSATGDASALDLVHPLGDLHVVVELAECSLPDARVLSQYIPAETDIAIEGGTPGRRHISRPG